MELMPIELICLDADDTLWHNMRFFHATQDALVQMLEPFADAGIARSSLEACEIRNLKLFGYGAKAFTLSMIETALDLSGDDLPAFRQCSIDVLALHVLRAGLRRRCGADHDR